MMHGKTVEWMLRTKIPGEATVVYEWWIKPEYSVNDIFCKKWNEQPICNSPEVKPTYVCLFHDGKESV
jgi:hypothetical protein